MIGSTIGDFIIDRELGRGAFGVVYQGHSHWNLDDLVAVKIIDEPGSSARQMTEPEILSRLNHPNIVRQRCFFHHDGKLVIVLDYIPGGDLKAVLESGREFSVEQVRDLLRDLGEALAYAHERNIVHRDIKLANIMLDDTGARTRFILTDFGIGRIADGVQHRPNTGGTFLFMAPEQLRGRPVEQSDLWALGVVAYRLLTGKMPFLGESLDELSRSILYSNPEVPSRCSRLAIDDQLDLLVMRLLEKSLNERVSSAKELISGCEEVSRTRTQVLQNFIFQDDSNSGLESHLGKLRGYRYLSIVAIVIFALAITAQLMLRGVLLMAGLICFYRSQANPEKKAKRWLAASLLLLGMSWVVQAKNSVIVDSDNDGPTDNRVVHFSQEDFPLQGKSKPNDELDSDELDSDELDSDHLEGDEQDDGDQKGEDEQRAGMSPWMQIGFAALTIFEVMSYPLMAIALAANRRIVRKIATCSLLLENPSHNPEYVEKMRQVVSERPNDVLYRLKFIEAMLANDMLAEVAVECQLVREIDPYNFNANLILANSLLELGLVQESEQVCRGYLNVTGYCFEFQMLLDRCLRRSEAS